MRMVTKEVGSEASLWNLTQSSLQMSNWALRSTSVLCLACKISLADLGHEFRILLR